MSYDDWLDVLEKCETRYEMATVIEGRLTQDDCVAWANGEMTASVCDLVLALDDLGYDIEIWDSPAGPEPVKVELSDWPAEPCPVCGTYVCMGCALRGATKDE